VDDGVLGKVIQQASEFPVKKRRKTEKKKDKK
jgi:hypothetical protein